MSSFNNIGVIGLGYVGLPLALQFARSGVSVLGFDVDLSKVEALNSGQSYIQHIPAGSIRSAREPDSSGRTMFAATTDFSRVREVDAVIICVPTPLTAHREPDISYIIKTGEAIAPHLKHGALVVLESTTYPGTTDEDLRRVLEDGSWKMEVGEAPSSKESTRGLRAGVDFFLAFSPEREDPGNPNSKIAEIPKVVGGYTPECLRRAVALYSKAVKTIIPVSSCRAAEATKLLENIFRSVNIALVNELKVVYGAMGIDVWEVINAAKTKPFGYMPFYPGPGLGGHCIPIDPFYLTWKAREYGKHTRFIELAGEINTSMPEYVINRVAEALNANRKSVKESRVLLLGLSYKPDVDDFRESPTFALMHLLEARGAAVEYHDPHISLIKPTREHAHFTGKQSRPWTRQEIGSYDAVVISTAHKAVNYAELAEWAGCIIDSRNAMALVPTKPGQVWKA